MGITALSKLLGLLRSSRLAALLGLSELSSVFTLSQRIPAVLSDTLFLAAISGCFLPLYPAEEQQRKRFASACLHMVLFFSLVLTVLGILLADPLVRCFAPHLSPFLHNKAVMLLRVSFPSVIGSGLVALLTALHQANHRFLMPALAGAIANLAVVIALTFVDPFSDTVTLFVITAILQASLIFQCLLLLPPLHQKLRFHRQVSEELRLLGPLLRRAPLVTVTASLLPLIRVLFFLLMGKVSRFGTAVADYAMLLLSAVSGILIAGTVNLCFPHLAVCRTPCRFRRCAAASLSGALLFSVPISLLLCFFADEIVTVLYQYGRFSQADTALVSEVLSILALALPWLVANEMLRRIADAASCSHRMLFLFFIAPLPLCVYGCLPTTSLRGLAFAFLFAQIGLALFGFWRLRRVIAMSPLVRSLPPILIGAASLSLCYCFFDRLQIRFTAPLLLFPCLTVLCGLPFYLIICRELLPGRERRSQRNEFSPQEKRAL
ncbi:MAG: hypothetical protein E7618_02210 [Ruminococcaceae bacterium]|nr:hypothetical protein [Oscillospiraceae bacterium]